MEDLNSHDDTFLLHGPAMKTSRSSSPTDNMRYPSFASTAASLGKAHQLGHQRNGSKDGSSMSILGQFSFAPTTQTTVVTTTTTTTTKFPPFAMRAPRRMQDLDPKHYPLASTPTPHALRSIEFDLEGKKTIFTEADDTTLALEQFEQESQKLQLSNGSVRTVKKSRPQQDHPLPSLSNGFAFGTVATPEQRPASPSSLAEHTRSDLHVMKDGKPRERKRKSMAIGYAEGSQSSHGNKSVPLMQSAHSQSPATPPIQERSRTHSRRRHKKRILEEDPSLSGSAGVSFSNAKDQEDTSGQEESTDISNRHIRALKSNTLVTPLSTRQQEQQELLPRRLLPENVVPTPPIFEDEANLFNRPAPRTGLSSVPSRLTTVDSATGQDGSLPSPSLSPVTAAANLHQHGDYFADTDSASEHMLSEDNDVDDIDAYMRDTPSRTSMVTAMQSPFQAAVQPLDERRPASSVNDIPAMLDFFEAIPDELKSYVMHQLLRRCPKPTLHVVADVVNPALKCDFLGMLPPELSLNIAKYLDVKSLCRASQVSKKWRHIINGDEKAWKELFDRDGFVLPEGELQRAILEGWGWQDPFGPSGWERDISAPNIFRSDSDRSIPSTPMMQVAVQGRPSTALITGTIRRQKRMAASKLSNRNKQVKREDTARDSLDLLHADSLLAQLSSLEGPYNAANAATLAVPHPQVDIPSLKDLHLYKSLYRRHYLIRKSWMQEDIKPRHIAFRAHDRHVVTCLQFDTDKIITGSDDTNINVYDTKSGALRARLQGHEGGVWALQYEGNILVSGSTDRSVRVWDIEKGRQMQVFQGHTSTVRCLQILLPTKVAETVDGKAIMMPKEPLIITGSRDSNLRVWKLPQAGDPYYYQAGPPQEDTDCPYFVRVLSGHQHSVRAIAAHADTLVSGSYDCTVRVWKISTGEVVHRLQGHSQKVYSVVLDQARNRCISGSMDNLVKIWSLDTGSCLYTLDGHSSLVGLLDLNSERLVSAAADSTLRIWDPENGQCKSTLTAHTGAITCFQHDGQKVISGSDRTLKMWDVKTGDCVKDLLTDLSGVWQVKFNARRCVAAVQRENMTYIEVLDFGASRDGVPSEKRGQRIVVDVDGNEVVEPLETLIDLDTIDDV